jgi:hypothetical protein
MHEILLYRKNKVITATLKGINEIESLGTAAS